MRDFKRLLTTHQSQNLHFDFTSTISIYLVFRELNKPSLDGDESFEISPFLNSELNPQSMS